jgi:hypothetical protein
MEQTTEQKTSRKASQCRMRPLEKKKSAFSSAIRIIVKVSDEAKHLAQWAL